MALHDPILTPLIDARDAAKRECALEKLIIDHVQPVVARVLSRYASQALPQHDADDLASTINLRIVRRLQEIDQNVPILQFDDYVAAVAYNVVHAFLRRKYPERTRLKNRLRYLFTRDARFALWDVDGTVVCGLAAWRGRAPLRRLMTVDDASAVMRDRRLPANALLALFSMANAPLTLEDVVSLAADLWQITDVKSVPAREDRHSASRDVAVDLETRQYVEALWREVLQLREPQRAALLLNLRDVRGTNGLALLIVSGAASFDEIASAIGMTPQRLAEIWNELPFDDNTIAGTLSLSRQQVINLRKAARERLARRMAVFQKPRP